MAETASEWDDASARILEEALSRIGIDHGHDYEITELTADLAAHGLVPALAFARSHAALREGEDE